MMNFTRRAGALLTLAAFAALTALAGFASPAVSADTITLRMSTPASETDQRSVALAEVFAPAVAEFATYEPHYNASLIAQGSELEAISSGDLPVCTATASRCRLSARSCAGIFR